MNEVNVVKFIRLLGYNDSDMVLRDSWINIPCPLAGKKHASGQDHHPSAGISVNSKGISFFKCFSCTPAPITLLRFVIGKSMDTEYRNPNLTLFYQQHELPFYDDTDKESDELFNPPEDEHRFKFNKWIPPKKDDEIEKEIFLPKFPEELLAHFPLLIENSDTVALGIRDYLINVRKISLGVIGDLGIRYNKNKNLIIFPLTDIKGNIQVLRARLCDINNKVMFTISSKQFNNKYKLPVIRSSGASFGLHLIDSTKPVIIVESETDCLLLKTYGFPNVVATTTASFSRSQIYSITSPNLWAAFDNDDAGKRAAKNLIGVSNGKLLHIINWENAGGKDPGDAENRLDIARAISKKILVDKKAKHKAYANG